MGVCIHTHEARLDGDYGRRVYDFPDAVRTDFEEHAGQLVAQCYDKNNKRCGAVVNPLSVLRT